MSPPLSGPRTLVLTARAPAPPALQLVRDGAVVATAAWTEDGPRDPQATEHGFLAWLPATPGDQLVAPGLRLPVTAETWRVSLIDHPAGWRAVDALPAVTIDSPAPGPILRDVALGTGGWLALLLAAAWAGRGARRRARSAPVPGPWPVGWLGAAAVLLGVAGTWPMLPALFENTLVQANFDGYGSGWLLWALGPGGAARPARIDTFAFAATGALLARLVAPWTAYHLATLLGTVLSFLAAAGVAVRVLGAGLAGGIVAGAAYALGPLAGTAVAEGHGGWLLAPGLPLLIGALLWAPDPARGGGPWTRALLATLAGSLCALQSGYTAVMAGLTVLLLTARDPAQLARIAALSVLPALAYAALVLPDAQDGVAGALPWSWYVDQLAALPPSDVATLDTLLGAPPGAGLVLHGARHALGAGLLTGGLLLPLLRRDRVGLRLAALGGVGLLLALGPALVTTAVEGGPAALGPLPFALAVAAAPPLALFRFPVRFLWLWTAAMGLGTARSLRWLQGRAPVLAALLGLTVLVESLLLGMRPAEPRTTRADFPSAHQALGPADVVLELWPLHAPGHPLGLELKELGCWGQLHHPAQLPVPCLDVAVDRAPLYPLQRALAQALVAGGPPPPELDDFGITAVAWHADATRPALAPRLAEQLAAWWGPPVAETTDGGEHVRLYRRRVGAAP